MANPYAPPSTVAIPDRPASGPAATYGFESPRQGVIYGLAACSAMTALFIPAMLWQASTTLPYSSATDSELDIEPVLFQGTAELAVAGIGVLALLAYFTTVVLWGMWSMRANRNMRALRPDGHFAITPGWTVGWFFVPIANLFKPYEAVKEMYVNSSTDGFSRMGVLGWWWATWIIGNVVSSLSMVPAMADPMAPATSALTAVDVFTSLLSIIAGILAIIIIRTINRNQLELVRRQR